MSRERRAVGASVPPLVVLFVCVFAPSFQHCGRVVRPARELVSEPGEVVFFAPYLVALALAVLVVAAFRVLDRRAAPGRLAVGLVVLAAPSPLAVGALKDHGGELLVAGVVGLSIGVGLLVVALRRAGVRRVLFALGAFAAFTAPLALRAVLDAHRALHPPPSGGGLVGLLFAITGERPPPREPEVLWGAWPLAISALALGAVVVWGLWPRFTRARGDGP